MTIYEITADYKALENLIAGMTDPETGETREFTDEEKAELTAWANEIEGNFENKFNNIYKVYCNKNAEAEVAEAERNTLKNEMDRLKKRANARLNEASRIKNLIGYAMDRLKMKKLKTTLFSIGYQATRKTAKPVAGFFKLDEIPVEYLKRELSPSAINEAINEGRLYEKTSNPLDSGKLFYRDENGEHELKGVAYTGGETLVIK
jgi:diadenosine tetraphosphate (Ap4A) HIT family hydrolase